MAALVPFLRRTASSRFRLGADVDDLVQDVCERALRRCNADRPRNPRAWLAAILHSVAVDRRRQAAAERRAIDSLAREILATPLRPPPDSPAAEADPDAQPPWAHLTPRDVQVALARVKAPYREAYELAVVGQRPYAEVAARLSLPYHTLATRIYRARRELRGILLAMARHGAGSGTVDQRTTSGRHSRS